MRVIDNVFEIGQTVYREVDPFQYPGKVVNFCVYRNEVRYYATFHDGGAIYFDFELSLNKNLLLALDNGSDED